MAKIGEQLTDEVRAACSISISYTEENFWGAAARILCELYNRYV